MIIVLIDREPEWREFAAEVLQDQGYKVLVLKEFSSEQSMLEQKNIDLIIADASLPDLLLSLALKHSDKRLLVFTARQSIPEAIMAYRHGALDYVGKAFDSDAIISSVQQALQKKPVKQRIVQ